MGLWNFFKLLFYAGAVLAEVQLKGTERSLYMLI